MENNDFLIEKLFKTEYSKIVAVLCNLFGIKHIEIAEDLVTDTFLLASENWKAKGKPEKPTAWLYTVAKNKTKDYFKRNKNFTENIIPNFADNETEYEELNLDLSEENIKDSQLKMVFTICNSVIPKEAQIGLALRILCGFGVEEIANAFLTTKETINKRLYRAKEKLRKEKITIQIPNDLEINERLETVLTTIYLLFNEGYYSSLPNKNVKKELCFEAMRLNYLLIENKQTNTPKVNALMSLMCFHASRFDARISPSGEHILYDDQNRDLWSTPLIDKGNQFLIASGRGESISKYHLEASIAYWHSTKIENKNKWENIHRLYNRLLQIEFSPITALNRTYVISKTKGKFEALKEAQKLNLKDNHFYHSLLGNLYTDIDNQKAISHYNEAISITKSKVDKESLKKKIKNINNTKK